MNLNNIGNNLFMTNSISKYEETNKSTDAKKKTSATEEQKSADVIYESSKNEETSSIKKNNKVDPETIAKLKADAEERLSQLRGIVEQLITKQGNTAQTANIWNQFREGILDGSIEVDPATAKQAAEDISEDGYWGVEQTSERILDFAKALTGNDPSKAEDMRKAIQKGFDAAEKLWGDKLPEISQKTHDAVMKGIDEWMNISEESNETDEIDD